MLIQKYISLVSDDLQTIEREDLAHDEDYVDDNDSHCGLDSLLDI